MTMWGDRGFGGVMGPERHGTPEGGMSGGAREGAIRTTAADWVARLRDETSGVEDWLAFDAWLEASPQHKAAYDDAMAVWADLERMAPQLRERLEQTSAPIRLSPRASRPHGVTQWALGGAVAAAAIALAMMPFARSLLNPSQVYETGRGETRTVVLADGSKVHMNAASRLTVRMTRRERQVTMNDAEAVFDIAHDPSRPFAITALDRVVRVIGTEFDVSSRGEKLAVTVRRGIVEVLPQTGADGAVRLIHGQRLDRAAGHAARISAVNPEDAFAWRSGRLVYRGQPLSVVVAELNRHFQQPVTLADPQTGRQPVSGVLVLDNEKAVVERLALMAPIAAVSSDTGYVLRLKGPSYR